MAAKEAELGQLQDAVRSAELSARGVQQQHDDARLRLENVATTAQYSAAKCAAMDGDMQKLRDQLTAAETKVQRLQATAQQLGERCERSAHSDAELERKLKMRERRIATIESADESLEVVEQRLRVASEQLARNEALAKVLGETLAMLRSARKKRFEALMHLKQNISLRVHHTFNVSVFRVCD